MALSAARLGANRRSLAAAIGAGVISSGGGSGGGGVGPPSGFAFVTINGSEPVTSGGEPVYAKVS